MKHIVFPFFWLAFGLVSFSCIREKYTQKDEVLCTLDQSKKQIELTGTLVVTSDDEFVFRSITDNKQKISVPTYLLPCSISLKKYLEDQYDAYSSIRGIEDSFWITLHGSYININAYLEKSNSKEKLQFLFDHVAIIDTPSIP